MLPKSITTIKYKIDTMELSCTECGKTFSDFKKYVFHIEVLHNISNLFSCPIRGCSRMYHTAHSLKYHLHSQHTLEEQKPNSTFPFINTEFSNANSDTAYTTAAVDVVDNKEKQQKMPEAFINDFKNMLNQSVQLFIAKLYNILNLSRDSIQNIIASLDSFLTTTVDIIMQSFSNTSETRSNELFIKVLGMLSLFMNAFKNYDTEYKRHKIFTKSNTFVEPTQVQVGVSQEVSNQKGNVEMVLKNRTICSMPWQNNLKTFLELPNVLKTITDHQLLLLRDDDSNSNVLRNVVNGSLWKSKLVTVTDKLLPLIIYFDDFESGNPLGSHAGVHKIGVIYISIATLPPDISSRLENVFVALIFNSNDREEFGNRAIFSKFITDLNSLNQNGLQIHVENTTEIVKFQVIAFSGDNLGIHSVFGLTGSFSAQNYCRFCTIPKTECVNLCEEIQSSLRKETDYHNHLESQLGLKEDCVWHDLHDFHVYKNLTIDVMHDLCEGVHRYSMALIIDNLNQYFSLETLNSRIKYFTYQSFEKNVPAGITRNHLNNGCIIISASEMLCLVRNLVYMVGDLIPTHNLIWENYLQLREITNILMAQVISQDMLAYLRTLIEEHHSSYLTLYGKSLKPKYHFLTHYCTVIEKIGPPVLISAFKFEAKHRDLKRVAQSISSRKNLPYSLGVRCQYQHSYRVLSRTGLEDRVKYGKTEAYDSNILPEHLKNSKCYCYTWYEINGVKYNSQNSLVYKYENDNPLFYKIDKIIIPELQSANVYFLCCVLRTLGYCSHLQSFEVVNTNDFAFIEKTDCFSPTPLMVHEVSGMGNFISL